MSSKPAPAADTHSETPVRKGKLRGLLMMIGGGVFILATVAGLWWWLSGPGTPPGALLAVALTELHEGRLESARAAVKKLQDSGQVDPDFPGGADFVLGIAMLRELPRPGDEDKPKPKPEEAGEPADEHAPAEDDPHAAEGHGSHGHGAKDHGAKPKAKGHGHGGGHGHGSHAAAEPEPEEPPKTPAEILTDAVKLLQAADLQGIPEEHRPEWTFWLGWGLFQSGKVDESVPLLESARETHSPGKRDAIQLLIEAGLDTRQPETAVQVLELTRELLADKTLPTELKDSAHLATTQALLFLSRPDEIENVLLLVSDSVESQQGVTVMRAQRAMQKNDFDLAIKLFEPVAKILEPKTRYPSEAVYLSGVCAEAVAAISKLKLDVDPSDSNRALYNKWLENAVTAYGHTKTRFEKSQEALAARLGRADSLRLLGRHEESFLEYKSVLRGVEEPERFRNRWLTREQLQDRIVSAWRALLAAGRFAEAVALANEMSPVIPRAQATQNAALANAQLAEKLEEDVASRPSGDTRQPREDLLARWRDCGTAYQLWAEADAPRAQEALEQSASYFLKGNDNAAAIKVLSRLMNLQAGPPIASALYLRAQAQLNLDKHDEALADLNQLMKDFPTDSKVFPAQVLLGKIQWEKNDLAAAETTWRKVLESAVIDPKSTEWRQSLFGLGRLLFFKAEGQRIANRDAPAATPGEKPADPILVYNEAIVRFEEFLERYPRSAESIECRLLLAKALHQASRELDAAESQAETNYARAEIERQKKEFLTRAVTQLQTLKKTYPDRRALAKVDTTTRLRLKNAGFELAQTLHKLNRFDEAVAEYQECLVGNPDASQVVVTFVEMSRCYRGLKDNRRAENSLSQARVRLKQLPDSAFSDEPGRFTRASLEQFLDGVASDELTVLAPAGATP